ncbi:carbohydrate-binding family 9-like protein [Algibacter mikhailovii]|uniref:Carbohydrate-binding domain-containing protein n=1 Tax=Algibacter mikhailovii TaxID=425498 RepID=A0A918R606_9FLAO|nr:carbohydrate-binding family 9-like protein [Algibacter mikhailovii]GGZ86093.1 hypothetical protein GCM10007028_25500 [Algibacter mikhailovii]
MKPNTKIYNVSRVEAGRLINGKGNLDIWDKAIVLNDFASPWENTVIDDIEFRALHNSENLFFQFKVYDSKIHINQADNSYVSIGNSDRVELFFRTNESLDPYYCLEIDPISRMMDFKARPNKLFDYNWNWPKTDISIKSKICKECFVVEVAISFFSLKAFNLIHDNIIEAGIFRAKYRKQECGAYKPTWITWVNPLTEIPDFHGPTSFGRLKLEN